MSGSNEHGFSGIEAAIVLIAFVVVGAVFSYAVLGAGFFTTQKSQQIAHASITETATGIELHGDVIGLDSYNKGQISVLEFDIEPPQGGLPVDISRLTMRFSTSNQSPVVLTYIPANGLATPPAYGMIPGSWTVISSELQPGKTVLQTGQHATIGAMPPVPLNPRESFNLQITPENGAALGIDKTIPSGVTNTTILY